MAQSSYFYENFNTGGHLMTLQMRSGSPKSGQHFDVSVIYLSKSGENQFTD